jgi:hypothetical protein
MWDSVHELIWDGLIWLPPFHCIQRSNSTSVEDTGADHVPMLIQSIILRLPVVGNPNHIMMRDGDKEHPWFKQHRDDVGCVGCLLHAHCVQALAHLPFHCRSLTPAVSTVG